MVAQQIIWSKRAITERQKILEYWISRNKSASYSIKLNTLFDATITSILHNPLAGKHTSSPSVRARTIREYQILYEILDAQIVLIVSVWHTRQNPERKAAG
jgi:plasmid stabilization system protein ParE